MTKTNATTVIVVFLTGVIAGGFLFGVGGPLHPGIDNHCSQSSSARVTY